MTRWPPRVLELASAVGRKTWSKWSPATHLWEPLDPAVAQLASRACTRVFIKGDWLILKAVLGSGPSTGTHTRCSAGTMIRAEKSRCRAAQESVMTWEHLPELSTGGDRCIVANSVWSHALRLHLRQQLQEHGSITGYGAEGE